VLVAVGLPTNERAALFRMARKVLRRPPAVS